MMPGVPVRDLIFDEPPETPTAPTLKPPRKRRKRTDRTAERRRAKPKKCQPGDPRDGAIWTNILNGIEYRWNAKRRLYFATGRRSIGMLD